MKAMDAEPRAEPFSGWTLLGIGLAASAAALVFFLGLDEPFALRGDNKLVHFPMKLEAWRQWETGRLPQWTSGLWCGYPLLGDATTGVWYLPHWLAFALTPAPHLRAFDVAEAMHLGLLVAGSAALLRRLGCGVAACALGAALAPLASQVLAWTAYLPGFSSLAWWPWALLLADRLVDADAPRRAIWLASLPIGAQVLAGYPEMALYSGCGAGAWLMFARGGARPRQRLLRTAVLAGASALLAGPQLVPSALTMQHSIRASALDLRGWLPLQGGLLDVVDFTLGPAELAILTPFLGAATLLLALAAIVLRAPRSGVLAGIAAVAGLAALGDRTPVYRLLSSLPLFDLFRGPHKLFLLTQLASLWLGALGFDALRRRAAGRSWQAGLAATLAVAAACEHAASFAAHLPRALGGHTRRELKISEALPLLERVAPLLAAPRDDGGPPPRISLGADTLALGSLPLVAGIETARGGGVALPSKHHEWLRERVPRGPQLDALGVGYLLRLGACAGRGSDGAVVIDDPRFCLQRNADPAPRYALERRVRRARDLETMMEEMARARPPATVSVLAPEEEALPGGPGPAGSVRVRSYRPGEVALSVRARGERMLLVRESWSPGWQARIDGAPAPVWPAAGSFFAVPVPSGEHAVELRFEAPGVGPGLALGAAWCAAGILAWRHPRHRSPASSDSSSSR